MKKCSGPCKELKPLAEFSRNRSTEDGLQNCCKQCNAKWNADHKEEQREYQAVYRKKNHQARLRHDRTPERKAQKRKNRTSPRGRILNILCSAKYRAARLGVGFDLTIDDIAMPTHCPIFGTPLAFSNSWNHVPSIDRVDCTKGYTRDNVVIVSMRANRIKSDATLDELKRLVAFYEAHLLHQTPTEPQ
jgi:hypothetical protein